MKVKLEVRGIRLDYLRPRTTIRQAALQDVDLQVMEGEEAPGGEGCLLHMSSDGKENTRKSH